MPVVPEAGGLLPLVGVPFEVVLLLLLRRAKPMKSSKSSSSNNKSKRQRTHSGTGPAVQFGSNGLQGGLGFDGVVVGVIVGVAVTGTAVGATVAVEVTTGGTTVVAVAAIVAVATGAGTVAVGGTEPPGELLSAKTAERVIVKAATATMRIMPMRLATMALRDRRDFG